MTADETISTPPIPLIRTIEDAGTEEDPGPRADDALSKEAVEQVLRAEIERLRAKLDDLKATRVDDAQTLLDALADRHRLEVQRVADALELCALREAVEGLRTERDEARTELARHAFAVAAAKRHVEACVRRRHGGSADDVASSFTAMQSAIDGLTASRGVSTLALETITEIDAPTLRLSVFAVETEVFERLCERIPEMLAAAQERLGPREVSP